MKVDVDKIVGEVLHLPLQTRALLAEKLLESLDYEEDFEVSAEWMDEIRRRCKEIDEGVVELIPAEQVFKELSRKSG
ncbi:addiction module protein [candidate division KSB1 bacterium]|nr:addiction module protein [candidate division KSB1 bacterium]